MTPTMTCSAWSSQMCVRDIPQPVGCPEWRWDDPAWDNPAGRVGYPAGRDNQAAAGMALEGRRPSPLRAGMSQRAGMTQAVVGCLSYWDVAPTH